MFPEIVTKSLRFFARVGEGLREGARKDWAGYRHILQGAVPGYEKSGGVGTDKYRDQA